MEMSPGLVVTDVEKDLGMNKHDDLESILSQYTDNSCLTNICQGWLSNCYTCYVRKIIIYISINWIHLLYINAFDTVVYWKVLILW